MAKDSQKEPDFFPFRVKDHGWVLKKDTSIESIGEAFRDIVYQLVSKDFTPGSVAEAMYNDAVSLMEAKSEKARKAADVRWNGSTKVEEESESASRSRSIPLPKNMDEVLDYAHDEGLFDDEWVKWWANENFKKGKGRLPDGKKIVNWKRQLIKAFNTKKKDNENETRD